MTVRGYKLTADVFADAEKQHRDLMEPWSTRVGEAEGLAEKQRVMRQGLAATFRERYPMPPGIPWPDDLVPALPPETERRA